MATKQAYKPANIKYKRYNVWLHMKSKIAANRVLKRFSRKIRKEDAIIVAVLVPTGHVADRAIRASECLSGLLRQLPVALKRVRRARVEFTDFAVDDLVTF